MIVIDQNARRKRLDDATTNVGLLKVGIGEEEEKFLELSLSKVVGKELHGV